MKITSTTLADWILRRSNLKSSTDYEVRVQIYGLIITNFLSLKTLTELSAFLRRAEVDTTVNHAIVFNDYIVSYCYCFKIAPNTWDCYADTFTPTGEYCND